MSRFREEVRRIAYGVRALAAIAYLLMATATLVLVHSEPDFNDWPAPLSLLFALLLPFPVYVYILLVGYVYRDAKRRGMRHVLWTWVAALVPNGVGIILYFVMRDPVASQACPQCSKTMRPGFAFCPHCGAALAKACSACRRTAEPDWSHCAYCGAKLA